MRVVKVMHTIKPQNDFRDHAVVEAFSLNNVIKKIVGEEKKGELNLSVFCA